MPHSSKFWDDKSELPCLASTWLRDKSGSSKPGGMWSRYWHALLSQHKKWVTPWFLADSQRRKVKSHQCLSYCPTDLENSPIKDPKVKVKISCCQEDLCNAAVLTEGSTWTMAGVILFSLGSVHLQTLLWWYIQQTLPLSFYPYVSG